MWPHISFRTSKSAFCNLRTQKWFDGFTTKDDKPLCSATVRLVFHDCAGPFNPGETVETVDNTIRLCDGGLDLSLSDHAGLRQLAVDPLAPLFNKWADKFESIADYWVAAGIYLSIYIIYKSYIYKYK